MKKVFVLALVVATALVAVSCRSTPPVRAQAEASPEALAHLRDGLDYLETGDLDRALSAFTQAIRLSPGYARARFYRGIAHLEREEFAQAISDFTEMLRLSPDYADAYFNRGAAYFYQGEFERAISDFETVLRLDPEALDAGEWLEFLGLQDL